MIDSADDENYILTYLLIAMISNYFQTNTNSKSDEHVEANVKKSPLCMLLIKLKSNLIKHGHLQTLLMLL